MILNELIHNQLYETQNSKSIPPTEEHDGKAQHHCWQSKKALYKIIHIGEQESEQEKGKRRDCCWHVLWICEKANLIYNLGKSFKS